MVYVSVQVETLRSYDLGMSQTLLTVAGLTIVGLLSPGPNFVMITGRALSSGRAAAFAAAIGVSTGSMTHAIFGIAGFGAVLRSSSSVFTVAKLLGASYLVWIGMKSLRGALRARRERGSAQASIERLQPISVRRSAIDGYLTQMSNPKSTLFFLAMFTTVVPAGTGLLESALIVATISALALAGYTLIAVLFSRDIFRRWYVGVGHRIDAVFGVVMIALGIRVALD